jgi:hypothetical protein
MQRSPDYCITFRQHMLCALHCRNHLSQSEYIIGEGTGKVDELRHYSYIKYN